MALTRAKLEELITAGEIEVGGGGVNANLLHNWDFRSPINQRAVTGAITTGTYFYDRWIRNSGTVTTNAAYLTIAASAVIEQRIEGNLLAGKIVTISVKVGTTVYSGTGTFPTSTGTASVTITGWGTATLGYATGYMYVRLSPTAASNVESVKGEIGNVTTLANDPPMDYGTEFAKCVMFFRKVHCRVTSYGYDANNVYFILPYEPLRGTAAVPTVTLISPPTSIMSINLINYTGWTGGVIEVEHQHALIGFGKASHGVTLIMWATLNAFVSKDL